jgi:hypothetical protein
MNIFAVSDDPAECARVLDDLRLRKMIVETAQLLSTALHELDHPNAHFVYKPTHKNHPCAKWVRSDLEHYAWTLDHLEWLLYEYKYRLNKSHKTEKIAVPLTVVGSSWRKLENFPNCTPYKDWDVFEAYKQTLRDKWQEDEAKGRPPKWTNRGAPEWM